MKRSIVEIQRELYRKRVIEYGDSPHSTYQNDRETQNLRYEKLLLHFIPIQRRLSILDVGCGLCDLNHYLNVNDIDYKYTGIDIVPEMVTLAKKKFPYIPVYTIDLFNNTFNYSFDIVTISGLFNMPGKILRTDWRKFMKQMILKIYEHCKVGIAFNFLSSHCPEKDKKLIYTSPLEMFEFCYKNLSRFIIVDHAYPLFEITITVFKPELVKKDYSQKSFQKYF